MFPILWKLAQPILSEESKKKIKVLGKNYKEELLRYIDEEQLPAYLGGTMTGPDNDHLCSHKARKYIYSQVVEGSIYTRHGRAPRVDLRYKVG